MVTLTGGSGDDTLTGGSSSDSLVGNAGNDQLFGGGNRDTLLGGDGQDTLRGGSGSDRLEGGNGLDTADYSTSSSGVSVNLDTGATSGGDAGGDTLIGLENIVGSGFNDTLIGDDLANALYGGAGNDTLDGGLGADLLDGGSGTDTVDYAASAAGVTVNLGTGLASGGDAAGDTLTGIEVLSGSAFDDLLTGNTGANTLSGGSGNDTLAGGAGADSLIGGTGTDNADYSASASGVTVNLSTGTHSGGDAAGDRLSGIEDLTGSAFNDSLTGDSTANTLFGGTGNDTLQGGGGADLLSGGAGIDTASYSSAGAGVTVNLSTNANLGSDAAGDTLTGIEALIGSAFNDILTGDSGSTSLYGGSSNDTLVGLGGADLLDGGSGTDMADYSASAAGVTINLGSGTATGGDATGDTLTGVENLTGTAFADSMTGDGSANTFFGGAGADVLSGAAGNDSLYGGDSDDTLTGGSGSDRLEGGSGTDTADYASASGGVNVNLDTGTASGSDASNDTLVAIENAIGTSFADTLTGNSGNNYLYGGTGNDQLFGGSGDDTLSGGAGIDTLNGGEDLDVIDYSASNAAVSVNLDTWVALYGHAQGDVLSGVDGIIGSAFNDTLIGYNQSGLTGDVYTNVFYGGLGNDYMDGAGSNDALYGGADNDTVLGGTGDDQTYGGDGSDALYGGTGNDIVDGGAGDDILDGGTGNDTLLGDAGNDALAGGLGNDSLFGGTGIDGLLGGDGADTLYGGDGGDSLSGGAGADYLVGGEGSDTFFGGLGDTIDGAEDGSENDVLDLTGSWPFRIIRDQGNPENGQVNFLDSFGNVIGTLNFANIETIVSCFTPGTLIATPKGPRKIEALQKGDMVVTRDHGPQPIRWIGQRRIGGAQLRDDAALQPILIRQGALGHGLPEVDMLVSRQHRMLLCGPRAELLFGADEVLVRAHHLTSLPGVSAVQMSEVTYLHMMFDRHEVVLSDGAWSESFQPGERSLGGLDHDERDELFKIFPELQNQAVPLQFESARVTLKAFEARVLLAA